MSKKLSAVLLLLIMTASFSFAQRDKSLSGGFVPKDGQTLLFCGQNNESSDSFVKLNKKVPAGFMFYTALSDLQGLEDNTDFGSGETSGDYLVKKYPGAALQIGLYLVNSLDDVIDGSLDENIKKLALWIKKVKVPVFLRIGYEFDYPENNYEPEKYKKAFRYIVDKFDGLRVANTAYVWHSYASLNPKGIEAWYPGDEYVDWCAISYFANPQWIPMVKFAQRHSKPLMIAECAPMLGNDLKEEGKLNWYNKLFRFIEMSNVKALCYINTDWDKLPMFSSYDWGNSSLNVSKEIKKMWLSRISDKRFINLDRLYNSISYDSERSAVVIFCHPDNKNSFNAKILQKVLKTLETSNVKYTVRDLYKMDFDPVLTLKERDMILEKKTPPDVQKEQKLIKEADIVIFIYPVWWNSAPAMLKGYMDRVFALGLAFEFIEHGGWSSIKSKEAYIFNTMATSKKAFEESQSDKAFAHLYDDMIFSTAGFKVVNHKYFFSIPADNEKTEERYLKEVEEIINNIN